MWRPQTWTALVLGVLVWAGPGTLPLEAVSGPVPAPAEAEPKAAEEWAVKLAPGSAPEDVARSVGATSWRALSGLPGYYVFSFAPPASESAEGVVWHMRAASVEAAPAIEWNERQVGRRRDLRALPTTEPLFASQWHLENRGQTGGLAQVDLQVRPVWEAGITGAGVGVSVLDTGTEYTHPDLIARFRQGWDAVGDDTTPLPDPSTWPNTDPEDHGTAVSGIILASVNDLGGSGIAPGADLYPVRIPLGENSRLTDVAEVEALSHLPETIWVSNNSWGPSDREGASLARPGSLVRSLFAEATANGRGGRGTIYVWAGGNGRERGQRSNYDGYADSRHTIAVGAMGQDGQASSFTEPGANILVAAPSLGAGRGIMTTDRLGSAGYATGDYERSFSGTSAAAPMVAGVVALMLEAQPNLGWRDVQHILARTAVRTDFDDAGWFPNGAGFAVHDDLGFGRVNALGAVRLAQQWTPVGPSVTRTFSSLQNATIPDGGSPLVRSGTIAQPVRVEHVELVLSLNHSQWRQLEVALVSPAGTRSVLIAPFANQTAGFTSPWTFTSVQFWGESGVGPWRLEVTDTETGTTGSVSRWELRVYGTDEEAAEIPTLRETPLPVDRVPFRLEPDALVASGAAPELLTAVALDGGTTWQDAAGAWWFEPVGDDHGEFPVGVTLRTGNGEARHGVVRLHRPLLRTDGVAADLLPGIVAAALARAPREGLVESVGELFAYTPAAASAAFRGLDRFELEAAGGGRLSVPVLYADRWAFAANGRDSVVRLDFGNRSLDERLTVEGWIRPDGWGEAATGFGRVFDKDSIVVFLNGYDHGFYNEASFVVFTEYADGSVGAFNSAPHTATLGAWQHLAVTFDVSRSPQVELFLDGQRLPLTSPADLLPPGPGPRLLNNAATNGSIGDNAGGLRGFRGLFHDLRVWSSVRGEAALAAAARGEEPAAHESLLMRLNPSEPNFATGSLPGSGAVVATVEAGQWAPVGSPWAGLREAFPGIAPEFGATWSHPAWGRLGGDFFPWVYASGWGWIYAFAEEGAAEWFYPAAGDFGWVFAKDGVYPWIYVHARGEWLYHAVGTAFFFSPAEGAWIGLE